MSREGEPGIALELLQGNLAFSHVEGRIWWFFSSWEGKLGVPLELQWEPQETSRVASEESSTLSSLEGEFGIACEEGSTEYLLECRILASSIPEA